MNSQRFNEFRWSVATTLARWSGNRLYRPIKALLGLSLVVALSSLSWAVGVRSGQREGVDFYHSMCYNNGGMIIDEQGRAVVCSPLTQIPKKELDNFQKV